MRARFDDYQRLMALGVPKEDARFVLPYSLRSNFFMTANARELIALICAMLAGRGAGFSEIEGLGAQLMCPNASDMISQIGEAIANRMTPRQLLRAMRPHPTFEEALGDALGDLDNKLNKTI